MEKPDITDILWNRLRDALSKYDNIPEDELDDVTNELFDLATSEGEKIRKSSQST